MWDKKNVIKSRNVDAYSFDRSLAFVKSTLVSEARTNMELLIAESVARMLALQRPVTVLLVLRSKIRPKLEYYSQNGQD